MEEQTRSNSRLPFIDARTAIPSLKPSLFLILFLLLSSNANAITYVSNCTYSTMLTNDNYILTQDINANFSSNPWFQPCFDIYSNFSLDCNGHTISLSQTSADKTYVYAILFRSTNSTIKNCILTNWTSPYWLQTVPVYFYYANYNTVDNTTFRFNNYAIEFSDSLYNTINNSIFKDTITGIAGNAYNTMIFIQYSYGNKFYNNLFNSTNIYVFDVFTPNTNYLNTTRQSGTRIYSEGTEIGGNYWTNSTNCGYSDTCEDSNNDKFCDIPHTESTFGGNTTDYLPLAGSTTTIIYVMPVGCRVCYTIHESGIAYFILNGICLVLNIVVCQAFLLMLLFLIGFGIWIYLKARRFWKSV